MSIYRHEHFLQFINLFIPKSIAWPSLHQFHGNHQTTSSFFTFLVLISQPTYAKRNIPSGQKPSAFDFIKNLHGCHKGNTTKGLHKLKHYLQQFGYLDPNQIHANDDEFDNSLESALKTYQQNYHITPTGTLDESTVSKMVSPRGGNADIIDGVNTMQKKNHHDPSSKSLHTVSHYSFFPNSPRWPASKTHLTYRFGPSTPTNAMDPVARAFQTWDSATHFSFQQVASTETSDLVIGFFRGDHGDGHPFDGPAPAGRTIAHAFAPTDGRFHYDEDEKWAVGAFEDRIDLETVALHEIGHLLGLGHSQVEGAIMYARIGTGETKGLHEDDLQGIRSLYGIA